MHSVKQLVIERAKKNSKPGKRSDRYKLGLAIEGGGMRGVVSAGMVSALEEIGLVNCFDVIYGSSAGCFNGAYFISGQAKFGTTIYYENINNSSFISVPRLFTSRPAINIEYITDHVILEEKTLDWKKVVTSDVELKIIVSSVEEADSVILDSYKNRDELYRAMGASAKIPYFSGSPVNLLGEHFLDALITEPIPFRSAIEDGCSHILVLCTRPHGARRGSNNIIDKYFVAPYLSEMNEKLSSVYLNRKKRYNRSLNELLNHSNNDDKKPNIYKISPNRKSHLISPIEKSREKLRDGAISGFASVMYEFGIDDFHCVDIIRAFDSDGRLISNLVNKFGKKNTFT